MFFLLRLTFWFALVLFLLPLGTSSQKDQGEIIGAFQAISAARQAVEDVAGMCGRQPEVCDTGRAALRTLGTRARDTARTTYETLDQTLEAAPASQQPGIPVPTPRPHQPVTPAE